MQKDLIRKKLQVKFKYICIKQKQKHLHSVVITKTGSKSEV